MSSLFSRLSLFFFIILLTLGLTTLWISHRSSQSYFLEFTQQLNSPIAMYMAENANLVRKNEPDLMALARLTSHVMVINPSVEVYLLDMEGQVIAPEVTSISNALRGRTTLSYVDLNPIMNFLRAGSTYPILGTNPKSDDGKSIFSVAPLYTTNSIAEKGQQIGYVYVVLAGERHQSLLNSLVDSYSLKSLYLTLAGTLLLALLAGIAVFFQLTRRLRQLTKNVGCWQESMNKLPLIGECDSPKGAYKFPIAGSDGVSRSYDEIDILSATYESMTTQLVSQFHHLQDSDKNRRELFANISHDLRTPLTTMQSYLETLVLKDDALSNSDRKKYLTTAHRQSVRLNILVMQLFELSKLSSGSVALQSEAFSLLELAYDCVQQFVLEATTKNIQLSVHPDSDESCQFEVFADIALVQRVFENLFVNALRFTPDGGCISIELLRREAGCVDVGIRDTGSGIPEERIARLFNRHCPENSFGNNADGNAGLGLSIVKHIVELHGRKVWLTSDPGLGTLVEFSLPTPSDAS
ncbi:MAG: two-component system OmpR family sensor kinase [Granulosicoccus sp.]|jgi:two-component system OmpR family sensor kinase